MKVAYFDCFSGASGDMLLGALLDAGMELDNLQDTISSLGLTQECSVKTKKVLKSQISATQVIIEPSQKQQALRRLSEIKKVIHDSSLPDKIKSRSIEVFQRLAEVEANIHGCPVEEVHFHEVGAVDSIVDIVGVLMGLRILGIEQVFASALPLGSGVIMTEHGNLPLPAPATLELLKGVPVYDSGIQTEMVTPTGAVLLTEVVEKFGGIPSMKIQGVGYGAGSRELPDRPNVVRIIIGERHDEKNLDSDVIGIIETNIDDSSPEFLGYLMERLLEQGALDVVFFPAQMKKNRPGVQVQIIGLPQEIRKLCQIAFEETTTLGVRVRFEQRWIAHRYTQVLDSPWGKVRVKAVKKDGSVVFVPEYEECKRIAREHNIPLKYVYAWVHSKGLEINDLKR